MAFQKTEISGYVYRRWERKLRGRVWMFSFVLLDGAGYTKGLPRTLDYLRKTIKIQNTTRPAGPEEETQSSTTSSGTPIQPAQHPKIRVQPGTPQIRSVSFYVYSVYQ
jgi:hypothetical protein